MWITTAAQLAEKLPMTAEELAAVQAVADRYPMCITPYYLGLIDPNDPDDPIRKMAVPAPIEEEEGGSFDTSGEQSNTRVPGLQHKYLQTAMVLTTNRCAMYCRHCFRKRLVGLTDEEIAANFERVTGYIREHEEITCDAIAYPVMQRALMAVQRFNNQMQRKGLIETNVRKEESGDFIAELCLRDDAGILMRLELSAPTLSQARGLTRAYEKQADSIYQQMMTLLLGGSGEKHADV